MRPARLAVAVHHRGRGHLSVGHCTGGESTHVSGPLSPTAQLLVNLAVAFSC